VNGLQWWHILIVVLVALVLFGGKRLPDAARGLGRSLRILKAEVGAMSEDKKDENLARTESQTPPLITPTPLPANVAEPLPPVQPVPNNAKITINGRPMGEAK
jgi:sec-independent protein translocase protein TatA